jgi:hypothetical protein
MTDQTPPPGQPTPEPPQASGPSAAPGDTPPPPPGGTTQVGQAPPPPPQPAKKSRLGLIIGLVAGLVALAVIAALVVIFVVNKEEKHSITIPSTAGGMKRDQDKEKELQQQLDAAEQQFKTQAKNVSYVKSGVYDQNDADRGPEGSLVFLGAKLKQVQSPTKFVESFGDQAKSNGFKIDNISAGDGGGKAVCAYQSTGQKVAICAWATKDSMGELVPTVPGYDADQLSKIMIDMRPDVEKTE